MGFDGIRPKAPGKVFMEAADFYLVFADGFAGPVPRYCVTMFLGRAVAVSRIRSG